MAELQQPKILVTGFGPFLDITNNPSYEIARRLSPTLTTSSGITVQLILPDAPIPARYHDILTTTSALIKEHSPDMVIHLGLAHGRTWFAVEQGAQREGYHEIVDMGRRVFTRAENKKIFGKESARLDSTLDLESAVEIWQDGVKGVVMPSPKSAPTGSEATSNNSKVKTKGKQKQKEAQTQKISGNSKGGQQVDVRLSDDVGNYVCGFMYYISLLEMQKSSGRRDTVFFHVPYMESEEEIRVGVRVAEELIRALVGVWRLR
ncbi:peptidase C15, pyroglutamyl peptidase I-like protein [Pleomassaria siparia CBS 279.74]|uniref:Peptidase C15, pyroglutamyl peptidase I-like protein n=1 Tax=Pleomassaria siparia CBS 279.74 TaxID=1314801 RepID=A0A6G1K5V4_9PLEO|nr:peptidase C15, pyroglutamyl peptidase I-like protein [Pleomassaria siparia CBS 279.74]